MPRPGKHGSLLAVVAILLFHFSCLAQQFSNDTLMEDMAGLDRNSVLNPAAKLQTLYSWKQRSETLRLPRDSVYARLLHKIAVYEFQVNRNYNLAIGLTLQALNINTAGSHGASLTMAVTDLYNVAVYYNRMSLFKKALLYYDSAIVLAGRTGDRYNVIGDSRLDRAYIYFRMGDYEKAVEESDRGIAFSLKNNDSLSYLFLLNQRAQSLFFQGKLSSTLSDVSIAIPLAERLNKPFDLASALKMQGFVFSKQRQFSLAAASFNKCITERIKSKAFGQVAGDYNDQGNFYSDSLKSYQRAENCYSIAIRYAKKEADSTRLARVSLNLGRNYFYQAKFDKAMSFQLQAMSYLKISKGSDFLLNPSAEELVPIGNKELIQSLFNSKTELLLGMYKQRHDRRLLTACLQTALLNDSLMMEVRREQLGEQSKLYWRNRSRDFFLHALEACYFANDYKLAFYFMEKSRSVLLQDKLNELGAAAFLPKEETAKLERLQISVVELQQQPGSFPDTSAAHKLLQLQLFEAKANLEQFIRSLEKAYPQYYQYKFADNVRSLASVQEFLGKHGQFFIDYFIEDTLSFALCIGPDTTRFITIREDMQNLLSRFIQFCSDENALNNSFPAYLASANNLYNILVKPFHLPAGRVIICQDNFVIPFEALSKDPAKASFLVNDYSFSYVYSARYLMNQYEKTAGKGDFLGIAPVDFAAYTGLPDLKRSELALKSCSEFYHQSKLLTHTDASRQNFMKQVAWYNTATILTHARADSSDEEPVLFMNDSVIHLSELQMLKKPAAKLIVLSACQTNVGLNRNGEGIFSLARGFSSAGIPSVAATQWVADEQAIYIISEKFNEYISKGMNKDEALQKAKLFFMHQDKRANILPYYWADMILIGNTEPLQFPAASKMSWLLPVVVFVVLMGLFLLILNPCLLMRRTGKYRKRLFFF
jgi:CHAT domain-containing protein/tetratricopeptide (TPR) repeat protein